MGTKIVVSTLLARNSVLRANNPKLYVLFNHQSVANNPLNLPNIHLVSKAI